MIRRTVALCLLLVSAVAYGASTATWEMNNYRDFVRGRFEGVSLSREGRIALAPRLDTVLTADQPVIWSVAQGQDGTIYASTGHRGRVYQIDKAGRSSVLWTADQPEVFALAVSPAGDLYAATSPNGKIYKIINGQAVEFFDPKSTYIWSLAFRRDGVLYAGTGDQGVVFRVDQSGKGEVYYATGQTNITSLAVDAQGRVLAGSEPNGIIYRIEAANRAFALYDATLPEIRAILPAGDGSLYIAAQGGGGARRAVTSGTAGQTPYAASQITAPGTTVTVTEEEVQAGLDIRARTEAGRTSLAAAPQVSSQFTTISDFPGVERSALYRIRTDNTVESIWSSKDESVYDLLVYGGQLVFTTDSHGRIYQASMDGKVTLLAQTNESEATRLLDSPTGLLIATADAGKLYRLSSDKASKGVYESPVHDAGTVARWGRLSWIAESAKDSRLAFRTRTGNSMRPDQTWSDWSAALADPVGSPIQSPNARYIQWKAELTGSTDASPILDSVTLAYLPQNTPPVVKNITISTQFGAASSQARAAASPSVSSSYSITVTESGEVPPQTSAGTPTQSLTRSSVRQMQVTWQAEDPDNDRLDFRLEFRGEGEREWKMVKENLRESSLILDSDTLADGRYMFRVTASDAPDNTAGTARTAEFVSAPVLVDNTPPLITTGAPRRTGERVEVEFDVTDAASSLRRAEYSVDAGFWMPAEAADGIFDSQHEQVRVRVEKLPAGEHLITLRVYDSAENAGLAKVVLR
jgi:hypothetical protein